jgi:hypothetical protein
MKVNVFNFPTLDDGRLAVEEKYCELLNVYRQGEYLDPEALDWMDSANNWLSSTAI